MKNLLHKLMTISEPEQWDDLDTTDFQGMPFHFYWKDSEGKLLGCNDSQARAAGFKKGADILGCTDFDLTWSEFAPTLRENDKTVMLKREAKIFMEPAIDSLGQDILVFGYKAPLRNKSKKVIGVMGASIWIDKVDALNCLLSNHTYQVKDNIAPLTQRQADCLFYLVKGLSIKGIAKVMKLAPKTIEHYLESVKLKLNCDNRAGLITKALQLSFIKQRILNC